MRKSGQLVNDLFLGYLRSLFVRCVLTPENSCARKKT